MQTQFSTIQKFIGTKNKQALKASLTLNYRNTCWLIAVAFAVVIALEYTTPSAYVFGYLYTGPILLASSRLSRKATFLVTLAAAVLTLLNLLIPDMTSYNPATLADRLIAVLALVVTGWLSDRNRLYEEALAQQQAQLRTQEQLAQVREDFVSTLTHDLKTPLLGAIETLKAFQMGQFGKVNSAQQNVLEMMTRSHRSTLQLVETVLNIYRNDTEGLKLQRSHVNLAEVAQEVIATLTDLAASRRVYVCHHYGESNFPYPLWVDGDALQLQRVFANLIVNSINHSPRGGRVEVILECIGATQQVLVLDSGPGITNEELPHLFERFYQGLSDRQAKGSGLGLYLTRQIVEAHGGTIWAENRSPQGALFGFRLPACPHKEVR